MTKYLFDKIEYESIPNPAIPILYRINRDIGADTQDIHWSHSDTNRFSLAAIKQTYLMTSLDGMSEAAPWRNWKHLGLDELSVEVDNRQLLEPVEASELEGYFVSYIIPEHPLRVVRLEGELMSMHTNNAIAAGSDLEASKDFAEQCLDHSRADGIMYQSRMNTYARNIYLFDRCRAKLPPTSVVLRRPLIDVIRPMKDFIQNSTGLEFLL